MGLRFANPKYYLGEIRNELVVQDDGVEISRAYLGKDNKFETIDVNYLFKKGFDPNTDIFTYVVIPDGSGLFGYLADDYKKLASKGDVSDYGRVKFLFEKGFTDEELYAGVIDMINSFASASTDASFADNELFTVKLGRNVANWVSNYRYKSNTNRREILKELHQDEWIWSYGRADDDTKEFIHRINKSLNPESAQPGQGE